MVNTQAKLHSRWETCNLLKWSKCYCKITNIVIIIADNNHNMLASHVSWGQGYQVTYPTSFRAYCLLVTQSPNVLITGVGGGVWVMELHLHVGN